MKNKITVGVKMFEGKKASKLFYQFISDMSPTQKDKFVAEVKDLFDRKTISEEGEFDCFKITEADLCSLVGKYSLHA